MKELYTEIQINASPDKVWKIFSDFENYHKWNPFIKSLVNEVKVGNKIMIELEQVNGKRMKFNPTILEFEKNKKLRWLGNFIISGLFDGEHIFEIIDNNDGTTKFIQKENFSGLLVQLFSKNLDKNTKPAFELMNKELKKYSEQI